MGEMASRCMDCGTPFCHWGCPVGNYIPEWNDLVFRKEWDEAVKLLAGTNVLPEITGRICPALCEYACVLGINDGPVTIRENELAVIEYGFKKGLIKPRPPLKRKDRKIAVIGSGPAGLSCAAWLNQAGYKVTVFEKDDKLGGILRYGIPDFKLEKWILDRRIDLWKKEGIRFVTAANVGTTIGIKKLQKEFNALCLAGGARVPRDLKVAGRTLSGIHFAIDYLIQSNQRVAGEKIPADKLIDARGKKVVVIGGGDTGADCVGVAHRQGASCLVQVEILAKPPESRSQDMPWPTYPKILKTTSSHEEGGKRLWSVQTKKFIGQNGRLKKILCESGGREFKIEADLVILALGFLSPQKQGLIEELNLELDSHGTVKTDSNFMTSAKAVFSCGDMRRGQSLVVWAIAEGYSAACQIDRYLTI